MFEIGRMARRAGASLVRLSALLMFVTAASAAPGDVFVTFYGADWTNRTFKGDGDFFHAFMCMDYHLNGGIKTDCYGFYPDHSKGIGVLVGGPGRIDYGDIRRFADRTVPIQSTSRPISEEQRQRIFSFMNDWEKRTYQLTSSNCIDLVDSLMRVLGLLTPPRTPTQTPAAYIREASKLNELYQPLPSAPNSVPVR